MSDVVTATRQVIQDLLAPELREQKARVDALEQRMIESFRHVDQRFEQVDQRFEQVDQRFEQVDQRFDLVDKRFDRVESRMDDGFRRMDSNFAEIRKLLADQRDYEQLSVRVASQHHDAVAGRDRSETPGPLRHLPQSTCGLRT